MQLLIKIFSRPNEDILLISDSSKAQLKLDWKPIVGFEELALRMIRNDLDLLKI